MKHDQLPRSLDLSIVDDIAVCTLVRPERRNALTGEIREALTALVTSLGRDEGIRGLVLASNGSFSSGQDLREARDFGPADIAAWIREHMDLYDALLAYPRPLIAAIQGCCVGAGLQIALLCDLRVGGPDALFAMPELDDGIPCILGVWTLWDVVGRSRTTEMVLTNRRVHATEAHEWGILNTIAAEGEVLSTALSVARELALKPQLGLRLTKERLRLVMRQQIDMLGVHAVYAHTTAFASGQPRDAMDAFLNKRRSQPAPLPLAVSNKAVRSTVP